MSTAVPVVRKTATVPSLGILGGMGGLASAEFVKTIYELNVTAAEQDAPVCLLYSDPTFPDRSEAILNGSEVDLVLQLTGALEALARQRCGKVVLACVTLHHFLPQVPRRLTQNIVSLIDTIIDELQKRDERHLLLCTTGTRAARIFERHPRWPLVAKCVVLPDADDQGRIHDMIYELKASRFPEDARALFSHLSGRYDARSFIAGCTELHLLNKRTAGASVQFIDPLVSIARNLRSLVNAHQ